LRYRHEKIVESISRLEDRVAASTAELEQMRHSYGDNEHDLAAMPISRSDTLDVTDEDLERELAEIRELEQRKRALEDRVTGMDRDLGGLMG
jgi:chromosome segregation ATPase